MAAQPILGVLAPNASELTQGASAGANLTYRGRVHLVDGTSPLAFVKVLSVRRLVNELVASQLTRSLGLLAPQPYLVRIDASSYPALFERLKCREEHLVAFGSKAISGSPLAKRINLDAPLQAEVFFKYLKQWQPLCALDSWIGNEDRHRANIVLDDRLRIWAIDHDQCLGTDTPYRSLQAQLPRANRFLQDNCRTLPLRLKHEASDAAQELMQRASILDVPGEVADSYASSWMQSVEVAALLQYLDQRRALIDELVCEALGIPRLTS